MMNEETAIKWIEDIDIVAAMISYTYRSVQKHFAKELAQYHIGWGHFAILMSLYDQDGRSQDSLAQSRGGFDKTMIAKSILRLEKEDCLPQNRSGRQKNQKALSYQNGQKTKSVS